MLFLLFLFQVDRANTDLCDNFHCNEGERVCGMRSEGDGVKLRIFESECAVLKYGCEVGSGLAFGIISMDFCSTAFHTEPTVALKSVTNKSCELNCTSSTGKVCGIRQDGEGFRVRMFENSCQLLKFSCVNGVDFSKTDLRICDGVEVETTTVVAVDILKDTAHDNVKIEPNTNGTVDEYAANENINFSTKINKFKNIVVIDSSMIDVNRINQTVDDFFAATHVFDLPVKEVSSFSPSTRRRLVKNWGPVKVFKPWITIPKNRSDDFDHRPTLSSCYHKCPRKCPDTYAPVCGVPGTVAREPTLMFQNHCFMDVAQCKMYWEDKSPTSISSAYTESSFLFCLGDQMNGMFRLLPLIRTLQHMGRLRSRGNYHYKIHNMKFINERLMRQPKLMG